MKLATFELFGRPQSGTVIIQLMAGWMFLITLEYQTSPIPKPSRKQSKAPFFLLKIACQNAHILKICNRQ